MNNYANNIITTFIGRENVSRIYDSLSNYFQHPRVNSYLKDHLPTSADHFADQIEREIRNSDPLPGVTWLDQLTCYNNQFIQDRIVFIKSHVLATDEQVPMYVVKDGLPTSRYGLKYHQRSANDILKSWHSNSGRGIQAREDPASDMYPNNPYYGSGWGDECGDGYENGSRYNEKFNAGQNPRAGYNIENRLDTGIMFCNQDDIGTQNHVEMYENTAYKHNLNNNRGREYEGYAMGVSNEYTDRRLLERQIFRKNEQGIENGIPVYRQRLHRRNVDTDVSEGLHNAEKGCKLSGYDMSSLYNRVDYKNHVRMQYQPGCDDRSTLRLQANNERVPDNLRYC